MDENTRAKLDELRARLTGASRPTPTGRPVTDLNIGRVPELSATEKNVRAENDTTILFDMIRSLKNTSAIPEPTVAMIVQTLVDTLDGELIKAMFFALLGLVTHEQIEEGRRTMIELSRSGELIDTYEKITGEEY